LLIAATVLALVVALAIGGRGLWRLVYRFAGPPPPPRQTDVAQIAGWMPIRLVSRAYRVPEPELHRALGVEQPEGRRSSTLDEIATRTGRSSEEVVEIVRQTVRDWQASHADPAGDGPPGRAPPPLPTGPPDTSGPPDRPGRPSP
jgi:hypothetical protein